MNSSSAAAAEKEEATLLGGCKHKSLSTSNVSAKLFAICLWYLVQTLRVLRTWCCLRHLRMVASFASFVITQLKQKLLLGTHSVYTQRHVHTRITYIFWGIFLIQFKSKQKISKQTRKSLIFSETRTALNLNTLICSVFRNYHKYCQFEWPA